MPDNCVAKETEILAMKGKLPEHELVKIRDTLLSSAWSLAGITELSVPGLEAERCVLHIRSSEYAKSN